MRVAALVTAVVTAAVITPYLLHQPTLAQDATINVTTLDDTIAADDECSLREALINAANAAAVHADCTAGAATNEVVIPAGTVVLNGTSLPVSGDILIRGAGMDETAVSGDSASAVFSVDSTGGVTFEDLEIRDGDAVAGGAGLRHLLGNLTLEGVRFVQNHSTDAGGALDSHFLAGHVRITSSEFIGNSSDNFGGAIAFNGEGDPRSLALADTHFEGNSTTGGGGAVNARFAAILVTDSTFVDNEAAAGGALASNGGEITITGSAFALNTATSSGGAILLSAGIFPGSLDISDTDIQDNESGTLGGGLALGGNISVALHDVAIDNNAASNGGGVSVVASLYHTVVDINDSRIFSNDASSNGGGIFFEAGTLTIERTSMSLNGGDLGDSALWIWSAPGQEVDVTFRESRVQAHTAPVPGAGIAFHPVGADATLLVDSSSFSGLSSAGYSAIGIHGGVQATVVNSTFTSSPGTAIRVSDPTTHMDIVNSTFVGDSTGSIVANHLLHAIHNGSITVRNSAFVLAREAACVEENNGTITGTNNADDDGTCPGAILLDGDELKPPFFDGHTWVHAPREDVSLIGAGDPAHCPDTDQRGFARAEACTIGSIEFYHTLFAPNLAKDAPDD